MNLEELRRYKPQIEAIAAKYGVSNIRVFGSTARGDAENKSDVDLLIHIEKGRSLFDFLRFRMNVEEAIGYPVDVVEENAEIHPIIWKNISGEAAPL